MIEAGLLVERLTKRFRKVVAVNDISFAVPRGSICGLVGPNGAGKTTTIRMLLDLVRPDAGTVRILGLDPVRNRLSVLQRVGYVPERHHIYEWMRVQQVLDFAAGVYPRWDWQECRQLNEILNLPLDRTVKALSRGELAKLALIAALSHRPEVLILDEPTSGLDPLVLSPQATAERGNAALAGIRNRSSNPHRQILWNIAIVLQAMMPRQVQRFYVCSFTSMQDAKVTLTYI